MAGYDGLTHPASEEWRIVDSNCDEAESYLKEQDQ
ncbi:MAG: hypothetical protein EZS28_046753, partial [Streblomastix strix]